MNAIAPPKAMRLLEMEKGKQGRIVSIDSKPLEVALLKLGLLAGDIFIVSDMAPFKGPVALQVEGTKIALRRSDAQFVTVEVIS